MNISDYNDLCPEEFRKYVGAWTIHMFQQYPISVEFSVSDNPNHPTISGKIWYDCGSETYRYKVYSYDDGEMRFLNTSRERLLSKISR